MKHLNIELKLKGITSYFKPKTEGNRYWPVLSISLHQRLIERDTSNFIGSFELDSTLRVFDSFSNKSGNVASFSKSMIHPEHSFTTDLHSFPKLSEMGPECRITCFYSHDSQVFSRSWYNYHWKGHVSLYKQIFAHQSFPFLSQKTEVVKIGWTRHHRDKRGTSCSNLLLNAQPSIIINTEV